MAYNGKPQSNSLPPAPTRTRLRAAHRRPPRHGPGCNAPPTPHEPGSGGRCTGERAAFAPVVPLSERRSRRLWAASL